MSNTQPQVIPDGIYFNMGSPEANQRYHDDPALSHSGMTKVLMSWPDFWVNSCHNPERKQNKKTDAMEFGEQSSLLLTQPKLFHKTYHTSSSSNAGAKQLWLSSTRWRDLQLSVNAVLDMEIGRDIFQDGYAEVAVFWTDVATGVRLRVKFDFLRHFGIVDVKRIKAMDSWTIGNAVRDQGLDIQAYLYQEGLRAMRRMLHDMGKEGRQEFAAKNGVDAAWLEDLTHDKDVMFRFLFQRSFAPYIWDFVELEDDALVEGANATFEAIRRYKAGIEQYGTGKPPMGRNKLRKIGSFHIPRRRYEFDDQP